MNRPNRIVREPGRGRGEQSDKAIVFHEFSSGTNGFRAVELGIKLQMDIEPALHTARPGIQRNDFGSPRQVVKKHQFPSSWASLRTSRSKVSRFERLLIGPERSDTLCNRVKIFPSHLPKDAQ